MLLNEGLEKLSFKSLKQGLVRAVNSALRQSGVLEVTHADDASSAANAYFDFQGWRIVFGGAHCVGPERVLKSC